MAPSDLVRAVLENSDLVKFAKYFPDSRESDNDIQQARSFVEMTKEQREPPESSSKRNRTMRFASPLFLLLLLILPVLFLKEIKLKGKTDSVLRFPGLAGLKGINPSLRTKMGKALPFASLVCLFLMIIALARPQSVSGRN